MAITIYDVAKKAGVGIGTVSRAINDSPQISPKTKARVLQVVGELKYQPHAVAQGLARKRTNTIACIVPFFTGYFFVELLRGIQSQITKYKYDLILYSVDEIDKKEMFLRRTLQERKVDGVLLISLKISDEYAPKFLHAKFPIVLVDSYHPELDSILVQNDEGAYLATEYLISLGHTRIGMINGQLKSTPAQLRLQGFRRALQDHNVPFNKDYLVISDFDGDNEVLPNDGFNKEAGYRAMQKLLDSGNGRPTAVFISSDIQAVGAIRAVTERGLRVSEDVAIVGFDDIELSEYLGLTTMRQPMFEMGELAVQRLMAKISGTDSKDFKKIFSTNLIIRESCGGQVEKES